MGIGDTIRYFNMPAQLDLKKIVVISNLFDFYILPLKFSIISPLILSNPYLSSGPVDDFLTLSAPAPAKPSCRSIYRKKNVRSGNRKSLRYFIGAAFVRYSQRDSVCPVPARGPTTRGRESMRERQEREREHARL
jgi:hypothetical protein